MELHANSTHVKYMHTELRANSTHVKYMHTKPCKLRFIILSIRTLRLTVLSTYTLSLITYTGGGDSSVVRLPDSWLKVAGSNPCRSGKIIFFSRINSLCWLLLQYPFHPCVTTVACKRSQSFCRKCRWQVTAKHTYTLHMWLCMKWHGAWLYGVHRTRAKTAAVSCGTSHASAVSTPLRWILKSALSKASHSCRITCKRSESAQERRIAQYKQSSIQFFFNKNVCHTHGITSWVHAHWASGMLAAGTVHTLWASWILNTHHMLIMIYTHGVSSRQSMCLSFTQWVSEKVITWTNFMHRIHSCCIIHCFWECLPNHDINHQAFYCFRF